jgi:hypothetical protein
MNPHINMILLLLPKPSFQINVVNRPRVIDLKQSNLILEAMLNTPLNQPKQPLHKIAILWICFFAAIRILISLSIGLGFDETHYALYAHYLDWSYYDHPPLVGWIHWPFQQLFGYSDFVTRLPAILIFSLASYQCYLFLLSTFKNLKAAQIGLITLQLTPMFNVLGFMLLPDTLLLLLVFILLSILKKINDSPLSWKLWIQLGITLGLCGLSKYTSILFVTSVVYLILNLILKKRLPTASLLSRLSLACTVSLILISPVLYWNAIHDWASFRYQTNHIVVANQFSFKTFLQSTASQFALYSPLFFLTAIWGFIRSLGGTRFFDLKYPAILGGSLFLFFTYSSLTSVNLPHWTSVFYVLFIPLSLALLYLQNPKLAKIITLISSLPSLALYGFVFIQPNNFSDLSSPFRDVGRYGPLMDEVNLEFNKNENPQKVIGVTNWSIASRVVFYNLRHPSEVQLFDDRTDQFEFFNPKNYQGYDVLFMNNAVIKKDLNQYPCKAMEPVKTVELKLRDVTVDRYELIWCRSIGQK